MRVVNGVIISSTLTDNFGDHYQPNIIIPNRLDGQVITHIGEKAFQNSGLISLILPDELISIGNFAFSTNNLVSVTFPVRLTHIGSSAFRDNSLPEVKLPEMIICIGDFAFLANNLTNVKLSKEIVFIGKKAFSSNSRLSSFVLPKVSLVDNLMRWKSSDGKVLEDE